MRKLHCTMITLLIVEGFFVLCMDFFLPVDCGWALDDEDTKPRKALGDPLWCSVILFISMYI